MPTLDHPSTLQLGGNGFVGSIPSSLNQLSRLQLLHLGSNALSGSIPPLGNLTALTYASLLQNIHVYRLFPCRSPCPALFTCVHSNSLLNLETNALSGPIPVSLSALKTLTCVSAGSMVWWSGIVTLRLHQRYCCVLVRAHQIPGPEWKQTQQHVVDDGAVADHAPVRRRGAAIIARACRGSLCHCRDDCLRYLSLASNSLTASDWTLLTSLSVLSCLDLHGNRLWGTIPSTMSQLTLLTLLDMSSNMLSGSVPSTLSALTRIG